MRSSLALLLIAMTTAACSQTGSTAAEKRRMAFWKTIGSTYDDAFKAAAKLESSHPVDDLQAELLAGAYFYKYVSGCGGPGTALDKGAYWLFSSREGAAGRPGPEIRVNKATGATSSKGRPTISDFQIYAKFVFWRGKR